MQGTSSMFKAGTRLITEWVELVEIFSRFVQQGVSPQLELFTTLFTSLLSQLSEIEMLMQHGLFDTLISPSSFDKIRSDVIVMRREANAARRLTVVARSIEFDQRDFGRRILDLGKSVARIFQLSIPKVVMVTAEVMRIRTNLKAICDDLFRTGTATCRFDDHAAALGFCMAQTSREFNRVFQALNLPLEVVVLEEDERASDTQSDRINGIAAAIESAGEVFTLAADPR
jgi:hypothetical protein